VHSRLVSRVVAVGVGLLVIGASSPAFASVDKSISAKNLKSLSKSVGNSKHLTFEATYVEVADGMTTTVTIAQAPGESDFSTSGESVITNGTKTDYCSTVSATPTCFAATGANPVANLENLFSPSVAVNAFKSAELSLGAHANGIKVTAASAKIAGQAVTCVTVTAHGQGEKYCVTKQGLLAYAGETKSTYFELTKYSSSPPASLFTVPAASTVTLPGGGSVP
jgi:hypothetical protein